MAGYVPTFQGGSTPGNPSQQPAGQAQYPAKPMPIASGGYQNPSLQRRAQSNLPYTPRNGNPRGAHNTPQRQRSSQTAQYQALLNSIAGLGGGQRMPQNNPAMNPYPVPGQRSGAGSYEDYVRNFQRPQRDPDMMGDMAFVPGRDTPLSEEAWREQQGGMERAYNGAFGGGQENFSGMTYALQHAQGRGGLRAGASPDAIRAMYEQLQQRGGYQPSPSGPKPTGGSGWGGMSGPPAGQIPNQPYYQDIYRGGQNPQLGRYRPPQMVNGQWTNQDIGGYSYNLPNAFGPYPQYGQGQYGYGQGYPMPQWPWGG